MKIAIAGHFEFRIKVQRKTACDCTTIPILRAGRFDLVVLVNVGQTPRSDSKQLAGCQSHPRTPSSSPDTIDS